MSCRFYSYDLLRVDQGIEYLIEDKLSELIDGSYLRDTTVIEELCEFSRNETSIFYVYLSGDISGCYRFKDGKAFETGWKPLSIKEQYAKYMKDPNRIK